MCIYLIGTEAYNQITKMFRCASFRGRNELHPWQFLGNSFVVMLWHLRLQVAHVRIHFEMVVSRLGGVKLPSCPPLVLGWRCMLHIWVQREPAPHRNRCATTQA